MTARKFRIRSAVSTTGTEVTVPSARIERERRGTKKKKPKHRGTGRVYPRGIRNISAEYIRSAVHERESRAAATAAAFGGALWPRRFCDLPM